VILDLFNEAVCNGREPAHAHAHGQVLAFNEAGLYVFHVRIAANCAFV
jgi:hypothetical protein